MWTGCNQMILKRKGVYMSLFTIKKKKHMLEVRATKLTYHQTVCPCFQQQHECVGGTMLYFVALVFCVCFFFSLWTAMCTPFLFTIIWSWLVHVHYTSSTSIVPYSSDLNFIWTSLCSDSSQCWALTQNMHHISCIWRPLLFCCAVYTAIDNPQCFMSDLHMCWTYLSVGPSKLKLTGPIPFTDIPFNLFLFFFFGVRLVVERIPDQRIRSSHTLGPVYLWFLSAINKDFVLLSTRAEVEAQPSVQSICPFTSLFWSCFSLALVSHFPQPETFLSLVFCVVPSFCTWLCKFDLCHIWSSCRPPWYTICHTNPVSTVPRPVLAFWSQFLPYPALQLS